MKTLAVSALAVVSMSIGPLSAAPIKVAAQTGNGPWVGCSLSGAAVPELQKRSGLQDLLRMPKQQDGARLDQC